MLSLFLVLCWIAVSSVTSEEKLCNPVLEIRYTTDTSVSLRWRCNSTFTASLKGFELYYRTEGMETFELLRTLDEWPHKVTLTDLPWQESYELFIEAMYSDRNTTDRSETINATLFTPPSMCNPYLEIQNTTVTSVTVKWSCNNTVTPFLQGFQLYYRIGDKGSLKVINIVDLEQDEATITELSWETNYQVFIEAVHSIDNGTDRSEIVHPKLLTPIKCSPVLDIKQTTVSRITIKWACSNKNPYPFEGYMLIYTRTKDRENDGKTVNLDHGQQEFTVKKLTCGDEYKFTLYVVRNNGFVFDESDFLIAVVGGLQTYPEKKEFLKVYDDSVVLKKDRLSPNCHITTFKVSLKQHDKLLREIYLRPGRYIFQYGVLQPNTEYELHVQLNTGLTDPGASYTFRTLCKDQVLEAPIRDQLLQVHSRYIVVDLEKWECLVTFAVEYRKSGSPYWNLVFNGSIAEKNSLLIQHLSPRDAYDVRITGRNGLEATVAEFQKLKYTENRGVCGGWNPLGNKCVKFVKEVGLLSKNDAQLVCKGFKRSMDIPSLLTINSLHEQLEVKRILQLPGPVWLGLRSDKGKVFSWDDGSEVAFSSFIKQYDHVKTDQCVQMLQVGFDGASWKRVNCNTGSYVACEKPKSLPSEELTEELLTTVEHLANRLKEAETKIKAGEKK